MLRFANGSMNISVSGASANRSVPVDTSNSSAANVSFDGLDITPRVDGDFWINVTTSEGTPPGAPTNVPTGETPIAYLRVDHSISDSDVGDVTFRVRVSKAMLAARGLTPADVVIYRYHDGSWQPATMSVAGETTDAYVLEASVEGLSVFAVTTGQSVPSPETATPNDSETTPDSPEMTPDNPETTATVTAGGSEDDTPTAGTTVTTATSNGFTPAAGPGFGVGQLVVAIVIGLCGILLYRRRSP